MRIGYHASHEQFAPSELLELASLAESAGFTACSCSDHFAPWNERQQHSGFAWSWLGAALRGTSLPFGVVCAPGQRYHPAIVAQAAATLSEMFHDRLWVALGSGQHVNEVITAERWLPKSERDARLLECAGIIRALWDGETVDHAGLVRVEGAKLYTRPAKPPLMIGAAITPKTARWVGGWADGLITISRPPKKLREVVDAFREGGGETKPMYLKAQISYADDEDSAMRGAWEQWRSNIFDSSVLTELRNPSQIDLASSFVTQDDLHEHVRISSSPSRFVDWLSADHELGFEQIYVHNVNLSQHRFIEAFSRHVLPHLLPKEDSR